MKKFKGLDVFDVDVKRIYLFFLWFTLSSLIQYVSSEECTYVNSCQCVYKNGSIVDLTSLGDRHKARFENITVGNYSYYYNPCYSFKLGTGNSACAKGVAVCQVSKIGHYFDCGDQNYVSFLWNKTTKLPYVQYVAAPRKTKVTLVCSETAYEPSLNVTGETERDVYEMALTSRCACPDLCRQNHLSTGSVLVIIFLIFVSLYLVLGIIHSSLTRGAHGWELIPHYEFWADFPLLVRDGCVFVVSGCKAETAYERI
ncbi:uncharacterized protein LOC118184404 [Stegodyphus dumicola]|uniref:uncharacterized protein LOC118184404 n=1 Tax=Stegodyphus dumicola TaxID=202533 RepID=UPI0015B0E52D|nr:uncharacterized protein LOC118184404 [Stegodyphus dumicola]